MLQRVIGFSNHLFAPPLLHSQAARDAWSVSATRSAIASLIAATAQPSGSRLFLLCGIFPGRAFQYEIAVNSEKSLPAIHVLAAYSFHSLSHSSYLVIPAFVAFISFSTARKSGSFTHSTMPALTSFTETPIFLMHISHRSKTGIFRFIHAIPDCSIPSITTFAVPYPVLPFWNLYSPYNLSTK
jgi:hypothetical protein